MPEQRTRWGGLPHPYRDFAIRAATALAMGTVVVAAALWGGLYAWALVVSLIATFAVSEYYAMTRTERRKPNEVFGMVAVAIMPFAAAIYETGFLAKGSATAAESGAIGLAAVTAGLLVVSLIWHLLFRQVTTADTAATVFGAVYVGFSLAHLVLIKGLDSGTELVLAMIVSVWANDTFAYLIGGSVGRHKMAPRISPKKTWEGFAAGTLATIAVWVGAYFMIRPTAGLWWYVVIGAAVSVAAVCGDLAESRLKREAGVKDSGRFLPGHGGFLDRFDSMILVAVVTYYLLILGGAR
jgi:phosphatidate cytidylyltransferase